MENEELRADVDLLALNREDVLIWLMKQYGEEIKRLVFTFIKTWPQAEDITQDVFITLYKKLDTFRGEATIRSWIYSIAINKSKDYLKSWSYRKMQLTDKLKGDPSSEKDAVAHHVISHTEGGIFYQAILQLPIKYREVILLHYYKEFSVREISNVLSINEATVKTRLCRGRKLLHDQYLEHGCER